MTEYSATIEIRDTDLSRAGDGINKSETRRVRAQRPEDLAAFLRGVADELDAAR